MSAPVLGPARLVLLHAGGSLLTVTDDGDPTGLHALRDEVIHSRLGAPFAEGEVVLVRAALVAMPFDEQEHAAVALEPRGLGVEDFGVGGTDVIAVEVEVNLLQVGNRHEVLGHGPGRAGGPSCTGAAGRAGTARTHPRLTAWAKSTRSRGIHPRITRLRGRARLHAAGAAARGRC